MSSTKALKMLRSEFVNELSSAHMRGYSQGMIAGLELAEKLTGHDLSEAKKVIAEEAEKDEKNNDNVKEADLDRRPAAAVRGPGPHNGRTQHSDDVARPGAS